MTTMQKLKQTIPFIILFLLLSLLGHELYSANPSKISSSLTGEPVPEFQLPSLFNSQKIFTQKNLRGRVSLLNIWASWCSACNMEHDMLMQIKNVYHVPIYGILYRDRASEAMRWLERNGNPYVMIGNDSQGNLAVDFGIYGTPETFVISPQGRIVYRHVGVIDQSTWNNTIYPIVKLYER